MMIDMVAAVASAVGGRPLWVLSCKGMADKVLANLAESCERFKKHRALQDESRPFYESLSEKDSAFVQDWVSAEIHDLSGRYRDKDLPRLLSKTWTKLFRKAPSTRKPMYVFRAVGDAHAKAVIDMKIGGEVTLDRFSSFAHSPDMVRNYALLASEPSVQMCIICVKIPAGTKYAFLSGMKLIGGFSAFSKDDPIRENIDSTQGELVLQPMTLVKKKNNGNHLICEGRYVRSHDRTRKVSVVTMAVR